MEAQKLQWIDLNEPIYDYLGRSEQSDHKYKKIFDIAYGGMEQMGLDAFYVVKSVRLPVLGNRTFQLPGDCKQWTKVGYLNGNGTIVPYAYNDGQSSYAGLLPDRLSRLGLLLNDYGGGWSDVYFNYWDGGVCSNVYGAPSGAPLLGSFTIANGFVQLNPGFGYASVMLEYVSNPGSDDTYFIPAQFREAMIAWISWQDIEHLPPSRRGGLGDKQMRRANFFNERRLAIARYKPIRLEQEYIWSLQNQRMVVKG